MTFTGVGSATFNPSGGNVTLSGPLFDGLANILSDAWLSANMEKVADKAVEITKQELDNVLVTQTPFYATQIQATVRSNRAAKHDVVVHDSGVIYGPWLAGTGSRNAPATRFAGYNHWRKVAQRLQSEAPLVLVGTLPQLVRKLNEK